MSGKLRPARAALWALRVLGAAALTGIYIRSHADAVASEALDFSAALRNSPDHSNAVVVVRITESDFRNVFAQTWPPASQQLQLLIDAVAAGRPRVVGIDLSTREAQFSQIRQSAGSTLVWARSGRCADDPMNLDCPDSELVPTAVLGSGIPALNTGFALITADGDGTLRRYARLQKTAIGDLPTFAYAVARLADPKLPAPEPGEFLINLQGYRQLHHLSAGDVLERARRPDWANGELAGKVVLIGGAFLRARDEHRTSLGTLYGVDIWAQIVSGELSRTAMKAPEALTVVLLSMVEAGLLMLLLSIKRRWVKWTSVAVALPLLVIGGSYVVWRSTALWHYFAPVVMFVLLLDLYERVKHHLSERHESARNETSEQAVTDPVSPAAPGTPA